MMVNMFFNSIAPANAVDVGSIPGLGRSPGEGNGNPLQYSCLENPVGREAWLAVIQGIAKGQITTARLSTRARFSDPWSSAIGCLLSGFLSA